MTSKIGSVVRFASNSFFALCLLVSASAPAQNLFVTTGSFVGFGKTGDTVNELTPGGVEIAFATLPSPLQSLAFNGAGDLFVACGGTDGSIFEYMPNGVRSSFASGVFANGVAFQGEILPVPEPSVLAFLTVSAFVVLGRRNLKLI